MLLLNSVIYILTVWLLGMCYGFVLLSSAAGQNGNVKLFAPGESLTYQLHSTVLLNEKDENTKNVGFFISGDVVVQTLWSQNNEKLLKIELRYPELHIKSRKAPSPDGFVAHKSKLKTFSNQPFLVHWNSGKIEKVLLAKNEPTSLWNLKKGIASLFQFQLLDGTIEETDASGTCTVSYISEGPHKFVKSKTDCLSPDFAYLKSPDLVLGTEVRSSRIAHYEFDKSNQYVKLIRFKESHKLYVIAKNDLGNQVEADQILTFTKKDTHSKTVTGRDVEEAIRTVINSDGVLYSQEFLKTEKETEGQDEIKNFTTQVNEVRDQLLTKTLGTAVSAKSFITLVTVGRKSTKEDISKALSLKKNKKILPQLYDVLGHVQTTASHKAVFAQLDFKNEEQLEQIERYLWALSTSTYPNSLIIKNLLEKYEKSTDLSAKIKETLLLTIAAMTNRLVLSSKTETKIPLRVEEMIQKGIENSKDEESYPYLRALKNLKSASSLSILLNVIKSGTSKEGVLAWKAIRSMDKSMWNDQVVKAAEKAFFELDKKYDSSSRTLAADILLESELDEKSLKHIIYHLASNDTLYELKQYTLQRIRMISEEDIAFRNRVEKIVKSDRFLNNYSVLSPRGLSTAIKRSFLKNSSGNGSLLSIQEINNNIVKRGVVNIQLDSNNQTKELFSLGIFARGLASFISSDNEADDEVATAGMELTVLGTQLRPFVFFSGQGELMGHVWSGTASERTTAFQALLMLQDHLEFLRLGSGFIVELDLKGALSFDLAGKVEISIWNRNAESLVEKTAGVFIFGLMRLDTSFVRSQVEFTASLEPKLTLESDIDFSSSMKFCLRLTQLDTIYRHNVFKIERIPGSKHKLRIARYKKVTAPGTTYSLNKKNNVMCSAIFP